MLDVAGLRDLAARAQENQAGSDDPLTDKEAQRIARKALRKYERLLAREARRGGVLVPMPAVRYGRFPSYRTRRRVVVSTNKAAQLVATELKRRGEADVHITHEIVTMWGEARIVFDIRERCPAVCLMHREPPPEWL